MAIAYVQGGIHENGSTTSTTCAVTLPAPVSSGNLLCVAVGWGTSSGTDTASVTDDKGNTYTLLDTDDGTVNNYALKTFYCPHVYNAPQTITATISPTRQFASIAVDEFSGTRVLDGHHIQAVSSVTGGTDAAGSGSFTTTQPGDLIWGFCVRLDAQGVSAGTGFTQRQLTNNEIITESQIQSSAGSVAALFSTSGGVSGQLTYKAAAIALRDASLPGSIVYIQGNIHLNGGTTSTTAAVTLAAPVGSGNLVCVTVGWVTATGTDTITVSDDKGNTYTVVDSVYEISASYSTATAYRLNVTNAPQTITATISTGRDFATIFVDEFAGVAATSAFDGNSAHTQNVGAGTDIVTSGVTGTTFDGDLIYGSAVNADGTGLVTGTGFTQHQYVSSTFSTEHMIQTSAGGVAATFSLTASGARVNAAVMAFRDAASIAPPPRVHFGSAGTYLTYGSRTNSTLVAPSGINDGDFLIAYLAAGQGTAPPPVFPTAPAGWSQLSVSPVSSYDGSFCLGYNIYYKIASSEAGNYTFTHATETTCGVIIRYTDVDTSAPFTPTPTANTRALFSGSSGTTVALGFTTVVDNTFVILAEHHWSGADGAMVPPTGTTPFFTERIDQTLIYIADGTLATAGATGNKSHSNYDAGGTSGQWGAYLIGLKPAPGSAATAGAGAASGTATVSGVGASLRLGVAASTGVATASGTGASLRAGVAASVGTSVVSGSSSSGIILTGVAASVGASTVAATGISIAASVAASVGVAVVSGVGVGGIFAASTAASVGTSTATAVSASIATSVAASVGVGVVTGVSPAGVLAAGAFTTAGTSTVSGVSYRLWSGQGVSTSLSTVLGVGRRIVILSSQGVARGTANVLGRSPIVLTPAAVGLEATLIVPEENRRFVFAKEQSEIEIPAEWRIITVSESIGK